MINLSCQRDREALKNEIGNLIESRSLATLNINIPSDFVKSVLDLMMPSKTALSKEEESKRSLHELFSNGLLFIVRETFIKVFNKRPPENLKIIISKFTGLIEAFQQRKKEKIFNIIKDIILEIADNKASDSQGSSQIASQISIAFKIFDLLEKSQKIDNEFDLKLEIVKIVEEWNIEIELKKLLSLIVFYQPWEPIIFQNKQTLANFEEILETISKAIKGLVNHHMVDSISKTLAFAYCFHKGEKSLLYCKKLLKLLFTS
jgi:hypothetical protein